MQLEIMPITSFLERLLKKEFVGDYTLYTSNNKIDNISNVMVVLDHDYDAPSEIDGFVWQLPCDDVFGIIENLQSQKPKPRLDDYIEAINYYIENDAFIDVENRENKPQGGFKIWG